MEFTLQILPCQSHLVAVKDGDGDFYDPDVWLLSCGCGSISVKNSYFEGLICRFFLQEQSRELEMLFEDNVWKLLEKLILEKVSM